MLVLVSYFPLLRGLPGKLVEAAEIAPLLDTHAGHVEAIVWALGDGGEISPAFAMDRADDVFEHLVEWSEGAPATWFKLLIDENDDEYALALVPDAQRSLDRFLLASTLVAGAEVPHHVLTSFEKRGEVSAPVARRSRATDALWSSLLRLCFRGGLGGVFRLA